MTPRKPARPRLPARFVRVLFISTGNAARSPIAEAILTWLAAGHAVAVSAGVAPKAEIHPLARAAVRNVFNSRIAQENPRDVRALTGEPFDYVFTLSPEALEQCPLLQADEGRIYWPVEDPARAQGTRDERQRAFDRVTRDLLKRLRAWWPPELPAGTLAEPPAPRPRKKTERAHWRTWPDVSAPLLAVAYFGPMRRCNNMCALFERAGFRVMCGDTYGRTPASLSVMPDGVIVRVDGGRRGDEPPRLEFCAVAALRELLGAVPMLMLGDRTPSTAEREILVTCHAGFLRRKPQTRAALIDAIEALVSFPSRS